MLKSGLRNFNLILIKLSLLCLKFSWSYHCQTCATCLSKKCRSNLIDIHVTQVSLQLLHSHSWRSLQTCTLEIFVLAQDLPVHVTIHFNPVSVMAFVWHRVLKVSFCLHYLWEALIKSLYNFYSVWDNINNFDFKPCHPTIYSWVSAQNDHSYWWA